MSDPDNYDDELVSSNPNQRNWRGIFIASLVILAVLALIVTSVVVLTPPDQGPRVKAARIKLADVVGHELMPLRFNGSWISGDELIFRDEWNNIVVLNAANLTSRVIMPNQTYRRLNAVKFTMSPDNKYLLLAHNVQKLFRYSFLAQYSIYDIGATHLFPLAVTGEVLDEHPYLLHAQWTPVGHGIVLVHDYDVFYRPSPKSPHAFRVSKTAVPGVIYNGIPDWLYEEEILGDSKALWLSADGQMLLYACFNDTLVEEFKFPWYGVNQETQQLYPQIRSLRYPKAGTTNPHVTLYVADLADPKNIRTRDLKPPMALDQNVGYYFTAVSWVSSTEVAVVWMNRAQNVTMVTLCKSPVWFCQEAQRVSGENRGWVESPGAPVFSPDGNTYLTLAPIRDGTSGYFRHVVAVNIPKKRFLPLTDGKYDVVRISAWDHTNQIVFYMAVPEGAAGSMHLYAVRSVAGGGGGRCLSCPQPAPPPDPPPSEAATTASTSETTPPGGQPPAGIRHSWQDDLRPPTAASPPTTLEERLPFKVNEGNSRPGACHYHSVHFSPSTEYYVLECLGPGVPSVELYHLPRPKQQHHDHHTLNHHPNHQQQPTTPVLNVSIPEPRHLVTLQNNTRLQERVEKIAMPQVKTFPVEISGGYQAQVRLYLPPGLREDEITEYPLVLQVYGGPGSQLVTERWKVDWATFLASAMDIIVGQIDGRGSSGRGYALMHQVYKKLGSVEVSDQLEVTEYLRDSLHFIDKRRIGVWGWSYGGFVAAMLLSAPDQDIFKCGIAIAPVTSWRLYDSAYTERYMGLPNATGNYRSYEESDLSRRVEGFRDKGLYLVHGTADDNVHLQHGLRLARALSDAGVVFTQQIYPDENHSLSGVKRHLYRSMSHFLEDCFRKQIPQEMKAGLRSGGTSPPECLLCET